MYKSLKDGIAITTKIKHAFMPITVEVVSQEKYNEWVAMAKKKYAMYPSNNNLIVENKK